VVPFPELLETSSEPPILLHPLAHPKDSEMAVRRQLLSGRSKAASVILNVQTDRRCCKRQADPNRVRLGMRKLSQILLGLPKPAADINDEGSFEMSISWLPRNALKIRQRPISDAPLDWLNPADSASNRNRQQKCSCARKCCWAWIALTSGRFVRKRS
jgi:hypothetical protein